MAAPRKRKKTPPFDPTGIDFSVITTALETGGRMIEQIINGIQYGSPEVRLLMLEECEVILECRVCRALFRALPNFIAHKRIYCTQPYCDFTHSKHLQSATDVAVPEQEVVVVEPEDASQKNLRPTAQQRKTKDKRKEIQKKDVMTASVATKKTCKAQTSNDKSNGQKPGNHLSSTNGTKTRSQQSEKTVADTVHQIEKGQLGKSQEYAYYTAAAEKAEKDKSMAEQCNSIVLTTISTTPHAMFVNRGSVPCDQAVTQPAPSQEGTRPASTSVVENQQMKHSPKEGATPVANQEPIGNKTASRTNKTAGSVDSSAVSSDDVASVPPKRQHMSKATVRNVSKVVKELRQNKEQILKAREETVGQTVREEACVADKAQKKAPEKSLLLSILSTSLPLPSHPASFKASTPGEDKSSREEARQPTPSPTPSSKSTYRLSVSDSKEANLCAVVKRCLTGRPGSLRVSPLKTRERNADSDTVSEAGSYSDREGAPSALSNGDQRVMDLEKKLCITCDRVFSTKKSLLYHCRCHHLGQRTIYPCPYCPRVFYYLSGLTRHLNQNHKKSRSMIDRMRKELHLQSYKQDIPEEEMLGAKKSSKSGDQDGKNEVKQKFHLSVHARKMVAISKSVNPGSSEMKKSPPATLNMPAQRRRVEVISSIRPKTKRQDNVYKKVYTTTSKRTQAALGSPVENPLSAPRRTRKLVAKALRTTRSKCVYNRITFDSPPNSPDQETKKTVTTKNTKAQSSSKIGHIRVDVSSSVSPVTSGKEHGKDVQNTFEMSTPLHIDSKNLCGKPQQEESKVHSTSLSDTASNCLPEDSQDEVRILTVTKQHVESELQPQTRARTSSVASDTAPTPGSSRQNLAQAGAKVSKPTISQETSQTTVQGRNVTRAATNLPESSGLLHTCTFCHQMFGRQTSLKAHLKICSKANLPLPTSQPSETQPAHKSPESQVKIGEDVGIRASLRRNEGRRQDSQDRSVQTSTRTLRGNSVEKSKSKPDVQHKPSAQLRDSKLRSDDGPAKDSCLIESSKSNARIVQQSQRPGIDKSKSTSSRECSKTRQIMEKCSNDSKSGERPSRSCRTTDSKASSSRDSSVDSVRARKSECKPTQLSAERSSHSLRRESESSRDSSIDSHSLVSNHDGQCQQDNLLVLSRQRLSEHLRAAATSRDKDVSVVKTGKSESCRDALVASKKNESGYVAASESSLDKSTSQRAVTTSVLRKTQKGKVIDSPKKLGTDSPVTLTDPQVRKPSLTQIDTSKKSSIVLIESPRQLPVTMANSPKKLSVILTESPKRLSVTLTPAPKKPSVTPTESPKKPSLESLSGTAAVLSAKHGTANPGSSQSEDMNEDTKIVGQSVKAPASQKVQILAEKVSKQEQCQPAQTDPQTVRDDSSSTSQPRENPKEGSQLNQRPRRKRRAPARVMDSEIMLPKSTPIKKKPCRDADLEDKDLGGESSDTMVLESSKDHQADVDSEKTMTQRLKKTGRLLERGKCRTYVVEPSPSGRLTCQDMRKVEEIIDKTGLTCRHCNEHFTTVSNLCRHAIRHLGWKRFRCEICSFCSYGRSECKTHILRKHFTSSDFMYDNTDRYITDLSRQAASLRSKKKRQTMVSRRQLEEGEGPYTIIRSSSRRARATLKREGDSSAVAGSSSTPDASPSDASLRQPASGEKTAAASTVSEPPKNKPSNTFNISTRNSPRNFDTRPYPRDDNPSTLSTLRGSCSKRNLSFSQDSSQAVEEEDRIMDSASEDKPTAQVTVLVSSIEDKDLNMLSSGVKVELPENKTTGSSVVIKKDVKTESKQESNMMTVQDTEPLAVCDEKKDGEAVDEKGIVIEGLEDPADNHRDGSEFVNTNSDNDLMKEEELQTLPKHFMSDDDDA